MDAILTSYPLSSAYREGLEELVAPGSLKMNLAELRQHAPVRMFQYLRSLDIERLFLPVEDENGVALLPVLKVLAVIIPAREIFLVNHDLCLQRIARGEAVGALFRLFQASIISQIAMLKAKSEVTGLLKEKRLNVERRSINKALYLNANLWFGVKAGGSVGHISGVVNALLDEGFTVDFASAGGSLMVKEDARFIQLQPPAYFGFPWELNYYRFHFDVVKQVSEILRNKTVEFIYQRLSVANYSGVVLSRRFGIPLILEYNGSEAWIAKNWGRPLKKQALAENVEEVNLRHAHLVVTISDVLKDELIERGVPKHRIVRYPNCIDPEIFNPERFTEEEITSLRKKYGIPADAIVVTFIGTFGQWHGAEVFAHAIKTLLDESRKWAEENKLYFMLVGDGLKMPAVREILGGYADSRYVSLPGLVPQQDAPLYLMASDILVSPHVPNADGSRFFGSPTKLFEYMAMGKAIIASDLDQIGDVLGNCLRIWEHDKSKPVEKQGQLAALCQPGRASLIAQGIQFLVNNKEWQKYLGQNARNEVLKRYTWRHHIQAILNSYSNT